MFYSLPSSSSSFSTGTSLLPPAMMASVSPSMNSPRRWPSLQPPLPICSTDSIPEFGPLGCSLLSSSALCSSGHTPYVQRPSFDHRSDSGLNRPSIPSYLLGGSPRPSMAMSTICSAPPSFGSVFLSRSYSLSFRDTSTWRGPSASTLMTSIS